MEAENEVRRVELALQESGWLRCSSSTTVRGATPGNTPPKSFPNAKASLDLVQTGYSKGEFDYLTLLTAQRTFHRVNLAYLESLLQEKFEPSPNRVLPSTGGLDAGG